MIYRSPHPALEILNVPFATAVLRHADRLAHKPALIDASSGQAMTYGQLLHAVERVAAGLHQRGVQKGDVVAIVAPNSIPYVVSFYAIATLGAIVAPANPLQTPSELGLQLRSQHARFIFTTNELMRVIQPATLPDATVEQCFILDDHPTLTTFDQLMTSDGPLPDVDIDPSRDLALLLRSSGTTGLPKSVMLTHRNLVSAGSMTAGPWEIEEPDIVTGQLPLFHSFGVLVTLASTPLSGGTSIIQTQPGFEGYLRLIQDYRATRTYVAPPTVIQFAKNPAVDVFDLSSLQVINSGGAPLGADIQEAAQSRLGCVVKQGYGLTEAIPLTIDPDDVTPTKAGAIGVITPNTEIRLVDPDTGFDVPAGERGEIYARGPQVMAGYLDDPIATSTTLDAEGWFHTGDLAFVDEDGYLYVVDRLKELIKHKGHQVAPAELEALLLTHPGVADAAVVRFPDDDAGEIPKAFVVARTPIDANELMAWVADRVAPYKKIRKVEFIDVIPKSPSGKILRRELIERDRAQHAVLV